MDHVELVLRAKAALDRVFSDRSVSRKTTKDSLEELKGEIDIMLDTLEDDPQSYE
jgi:hypothetical protein